MANLFVGPNRPFARPEDACKAAKPQDAVYLEPPPGGVYHCPNGLPALPTGLKIYGRNNVTLKRTATGAGQPILTACDDLFVQGVIFDAAGAGRAINIGKVKNVSLRACRFRGHDAITAAGVKTLLLDTCHFELLDKYALYCTDPGRDAAYGQLWNENVTVRNCDSVGSKYEPLWRFHFTRKLRIVGGQLRNPDRAPFKSSKNAAAITFRSVDDGAITGTETDSIGLGPLKSTPLQRVRKVVVRNAKMHSGYIALDAGVDDVLFETCDLTGSWSGSVFAYPGAEKATDGVTMIPAACNIRVVDCDARYTGGKIINVKTPNVTFASTEFNGVAV